MQKSALKETGQPARDLKPVFFVPPPPVWIAQPAPSFEFFDIEKPVFYQVNGRLMAFAWEV